MKISVEELQSRLERDAPETIEVYLDQADMEAIYDVCAALGYGVVREIRSKLYDVVFTRITDMKRKGWDVKALVSALAEERQVGFRVEKLRRERERERERDGST